MNDVLNDMYEVRKANFDGEAKGAGNIALAMLRVVRGFMAYLGWPENEWGYRGIGAFSERAFYADKFRAENKIALRMVCVVRLAMKRGDSVDVDVSGTLERDGTLSLILNNIAILVDMSNERTMSLGFESMKDALLLRVASAAEEAVRRA